jgi:hypothetical protein
MKIYVDHGDVDVPELLLRLALGDDFSRILCEPALPGPVWIVVATTTSGFFAWNPGPRTFLDQGQHVRVSRGHCR